MSSNIQSRRQFEFMPEAHNVSIDKVELQNAGHDIYDYRHAVVNHNQVPSSTFNVTTNAPECFSGNYFYSGSHSEHSPLYRKASANVPRFQPLERNLCPTKGPPPRYIPCAHSSGLNDPPHFVYYPPLPSSSHQWRARPQPMHDLLQRDPGHFRNQLHGLHRGDPSTAYPSSRPFYP
ncbi:hypothetical protein FA13DRAFT_1735855 [Coprinellus micaceus]|uniref:Uncharacterized protein n=1 Tax=Coprinellus micaceus TaxID=71717 RepID=A0A4Y7T3P3_COPMI|nr:hypothetical protein FA13DRAFT_1735855 [Coprinellus micaceus]